MTVEQLLKPRFKVIADYPGNPQPIGKVTIEVATASYFRKFPANYQELHWWEERAIEDMPKYVKLVKERKSYQLLSGTIREVTEWHISKKYVTADCFPVYIAAEDLLPATEQEYIDYMNRNKS